MYSISINTSSILLLLPCSAISLELIPTGYIPSLSFMDIIACVCRVEYVLSCIHNDLRNKKTYGHGSTVAADPRWVCIKRSLVKPCGMSLLFSHLLHAFLFATKQILKRNPNYLSAQLGTMRLDGTQCTVSSTWSENTIDRTEMSKMRTSLPTP